MKALLERILQTISILSCFCLGVYYAENDFIASLAFVVILLGMYREIQLEKLKKEYKKILEVICL